MEKVWVMFTLVPQRDSTVQPATRGQYLMNQGSFDVASILYRFYLIVQYKLTILRTVEVDMALLNRHRCHSKP
jgi:hypothetical protein